MTRLFSRNRKSGKAGGRPFASEELDFSTLGVSGVIGTAANATAYLSQHPELTEVGKLGVQYDYDTAGNSSVTYTVPTGKYWRLIGLHTELETDANAANRQVKVAMRDADNTAFNTVTYDTVTASLVRRKTMLFESSATEVTGDTASQACGTAATGTLSMATKPSDGDTVVIGSTTYTFETTLTDSANYVLIGAAVANSKANLLAAITGGETAGGGSAGTEWGTGTVANTQVQVPANAWSGDDLVVAYRWPGTAGNSIAVSETFTDATDAWGASTLSGGVELNYPSDGPYLGPGEDVNISVTNGVAGDDIDTVLFYIEYDNDPRPS